MSRGESGRRNRPSRAAANQDESAQDHVSAQDEKPIAGGHTTSTDPSAETANETSSTSFRSSLLRVLLVDVTVAALFSALFPRRSGGLIALALSIPFVFLLVFRPVPRRLALRNLVRRPGDTAMMFAGAVVATTMVTGSLLVGSSLKETLRQPIAAQLGPVDELVYAAGLDQAEALDRAVFSAVRDFPDETRSEAAFLRLATATASISTRAPQPRSVARAQLVELSFRDSAAFGPDPAATGITGADPKRGHAVAGADLLRALGARAGDTVDIALYGTVISMKIERSVPRRGVAGLWTGSGSQSMNLFVERGTLKELAARGGLAAIASPPVVAIAIWNGHGMFDEARRTRAVVQTIENSITAPTIATEGAVKTDETFSATVLDLKRRALDRADNLTGAAAPMLVALRVMTIIGAMFVVGALFLLLAAQRAREFGVLRAVGMGRTQLLSALALEGWVHAVVAGIVGMAGGLAAAWMATGAISRFFAGRASESVVRFSAPLSVALDGMCMGLTIVLATAVIAAISTSRRTVGGSQKGEAYAASVLRHARSRRLAVFVSITAAAWLSIAIESDNALGLLLAPAALAAGIGLLLVQRTTTTLAATIVASVACGWELLAPRLLRGHVPIPASALAAGACVMVLALVVLAGTHLGSVESRLEWMANIRLTAPMLTPIRLGVREASRRPVRTAVMTAAIAVTVLALSINTVLAGQANGTVNRALSGAQGGFDLVVRSSPSSPVPTFRLAGHTSVAQIAAMTDTAAEITDGQGKVVGTTLSGFDRALVEHGPPELIERETNFSSDQAAYEKVRTDPGWAIVPFRSRPLIQPGDMMYALDLGSGRSLSLKVAAVARSSLPDDAVLVGVDTLHTLVGRDLQPNRHAVKLKSGIDTRSFARAIGLQFRANAAEISTFQELARVNRSPQVSVAQLLDGLLALEIFVGIAGLIIVFLRNIRERRPEIAVLQTIGYAAKTIRWSFVAESGLIACQGIVVGLFAGIVTARRMAAIGTLGEHLPMSVPIWRLLVIAVVTFTGVVVTSATAATRSGSNTPASSLDH